MWTNFFASKVKFRNPKLSIHQQSIKTRLRKIGTLLGPCYLHFDALIKQTIMYSKLDLG